MICEKCDGCGLVTDAADSMPWSQWIKTPAQSDISRTTIVKPVVCPDCGGYGTSGFVETPKEARVINKMTLTHVSLMPDGTAGMGARIDEVSLVKSVPAPNAEVHYEQALPTKGRQSVTEACVEFLRQREAKGIATYGRSLETFNGRSPTRDLKEELVDALQYAMQWDIERELIRELMDKLVRNVGNLTGEEWNVVYSFIGK